MKTLLISITIALLMSGCGVWAEIEITRRDPADPNAVVTTKILYHNWRPIGPENVSVTLPGGGSLRIGEQATQGQVIETLAGTVVTLSGAGGG